MFVAHKTRQRERKKFPVIGLFQKRMLSDYSTSTKIIPVLFRQAEQDHSIKKTGKKMFPGFFGVRTSARCPTKLLTCWITCMIPDLNGSTDTY